MADFLDLHPETILTDRIKFFKKIMAMKHTNEGWGLSINPGIECTEVKLGDPTGKQGPILQCTFEFIVTKEMTNPNNMAHGGFQSTLFDNYSTYCVAGLDKHWQQYIKEIKETKANETKRKEILMNQTKDIAKSIVAGMGVSRTLTGTYFKGVPLGSKAVLKVDLVAESKTFMVLEGRLYNEKNEICTFFFHDKVKVPNMNKRNNDDNNKKQKSKI